LIFILGTKKKKNFFSYKRKTTGDNDEYNKAKKKENELINQSVGYRTLSNQLLSIVRASQIISGKQYSLGKACFTFSSK
jgi:hypothetical protein